MIRIGKHISDLLHDNECVIVPKMGGFINVRFDEKVQTLKMDSKSKEILFNSLLDFNDGLLANHIVKNEKCSYLEAISEIEKFVKEFHKEIGSGKKFIIERVGVLYKDKARNVIIDPIINTDFSIDTNKKENKVVINNEIIKEVVAIKDDENVTSNNVIEDVADVFKNEDKGDSKSVIEKIIEPVKTFDANKKIDPPVVNYIKKIENEKKPEKVELKGYTDQPSIPSYTLAENISETNKQTEKSDLAPSIIEVEQKPKPKSKSKIKFLLFFLFLCVLTLCNYLYFSNKSKTNPSTNTVESPIVNTVESRIENKESKLPESGKSVEANTKKAVSNSGNSSSEKNSFNNHSTTLSDNTITSTGENKFFIIAGSFKSYENAKRKLDELKSKGFEKAQIFSDSRNLQLVSYDDFNSLQEAEKNMINIRMNYKDAWIYHR